MLARRLAGLRCGDRRGQKKGIGWDLVHVCIDDASRLAYTEILPDEKKESACAFLARALAFFAAHGVSVARVMTDNGSAWAATTSGGSVRRPASGTSAPGPIRRAPTARPSASSRHRCASGPMLVPTAPQRSENRP